jgi:hypothetical protein
MIAVNGISGDRVLPGGVKVDIRARFLVQDVEIAGKPVPSSAASRPGAGPE